MTHLKVLMPANQLHSVFHALVNSGRKDQSTENVQLPRFSSGVLNKDDEGPSQPRQRLVTSNERQRSIVYVVCWIFIVYEQE